MDEKKEGRLSNFELLRIISIAMILIHHYSLHNGLISNINTTPIVKFFSMFGFASGKLGVNIFILITGYFMIGKNIKFSKIVKLWLEIFMYSLGIYVIGVIFGKAEFSIKELIRSALPISFNKYWFITVYFFLYLSIPILNKYISKINQEEYKKLIIKLFIFLVIPFTIIYKAEAYTAIETYPLSQLPIFILLYLISGYIKLYGIKRLDNIKLSYLMMFNIIRYLTYILILTLIKQFELTHNGIFCIEFMQTRQQAIFTMVFSITIFYLFKRLKIKNNFINILSSTTLGIYLLQSHDLTSAKLYRDLVHTSNYYETSFIIIHAFIVISMIILTGFIIDLLRIYLIEKPIFKLINLDEKTKKIDEFIN